MGNYGPTITLNTWQLFYLNLYATPDSSSIALNLFVGDSFVTGSSRTLGDLSALKLRVGDSTKSFIGDVSTVRILSPGVRFLSLSKKLFFFLLKSNFPSADTCSSNIGIGFDAYALSCSESASFNPYYNKCYSSCPIDATTPFTDAPLTLCCKKKKFFVMLKISL